MRFDSAALRIFPFPIEQRLVVPRKPSTGSDRQVGNRWTPRLAEAGWTPIADFFLANYHRLNITHGEAMVIVHLMSFKWDEDAPYPSLGTIAHRMGITVPSVRSLLRNLERKGFVWRQRTKGSTNRFHLEGLFVKLEHLMDQDAEGVKGELRSGA